MENKIIVTTINGVGIVQVKHDIASFTLSLRTKSESLDSSKSHLEDKIAEALDVLTSKNMKLDTEIQTNRFNYKLEHREGSEKYAAGFQSIATISWTMFVDDNLDDVYKSCLKLDVNMPRPTFSIKDRDALQVEALQKAKEHIKLTLEKECSLLGVSQFDLKILNWTIGYGGQLSVSSPSNGMGNYYLNNSVMGVTGVMGPTGPMGPQGTYQPTSQKVGSIYQELLDYIPLDPGTVTVTVPVQVNYVWNK